VKKPIQKAKLLKRSKLKIKNSKKKIQSIKKTDDIYSIYSHSVDKFFSEVKKATVIYLQASTDLQQEILESWKHNMDTAMVLQKKFSDKSKPSVRLSMDSIRMIENITKQTSKAHDLQNKMFLASVDAIRKNIRTCNENEKIFSQLNKQVVQTCMNASVSPAIDPQLVKNAVLEFQKIIGKNYLGTNLQKVEFFKK